MLKPRCAIRVLFIRRGETPKVSWYTFKSLFSRRKDTRLPPENELLVLSRKI